MIKKILLILFLISTNVFAMQSSHGLDGNVQNVIDASTNARNHSNMGNIYFSQGNFISALTEYKIAYSLTYNSSVSSYYLYNISRCYSAVGEYSNAKTFLEEAIKKDCMNLTYYKALADTYILLKIDNKKIKTLLKDNSNPYNRILAGLIYLQKGDKLNAKNIFDEFIVNNPNMLITNDLKILLRNL